MMKLYLCVVGWMVLFVANCYGLKFILAALDYPSDPAFFAGFIGLALLTLTDYLIVARVLKKHKPE